MLLQILMQIPEQMQSNSDLFTYMLIGGGAGGGSAAVTLAVLKNKIKTITERIEKVENKFDNHEKEGVLKSQQLTRLETQMESVKELLIKVEHKLDRK